MNTYDNEIPKRIKKKESHVSKAKKKAQHKHQYAECLIRYKLQDKEDINTDLKKYCTICGKINNLKLKDYRAKTSIKRGRGYYLFSDEELYDRYHDKMPVFYVNDYFNENYVNLEDLEK